MSVVNVVHPAFEIMKSDLDTYQNYLILERIIRTCYRSEGNITELSHKKMIEKIMQFDHTAMIEHLSITVKFYIDRGCYSDDTEVLTYYGWKFFKDVAQDDLIACLDDNGELSFENQTKEKLVKDFSGDILEFETTGIDLKVTPDHKMWVFDYDKRAKTSRDWKFIDAENLTNGRYTFNKTCNCWNGEEKPIILDKHPTKSLAFPMKRIEGEKLEDFYELMGLWVTDGSFNSGKNSGSGSSIVITQTKKLGCDRIEHLCKSLSFSYNKQKSNYRIGNLQLVQFIGDNFGFDPKSKICFVPEFIKNSSSRLIKRFLDGVIIGNGSVKKCGYSCVYTASKKFSDDLQELFLKVGISANIRTIQPKNRTFPGRKEETVCTATIYVVSVCREKRSKPLLNKSCAKKFGEKVKYSGKVYCLTVPYHRLYVRRNGKACWCGNCTHEFVRHRLCSFAQSSTRYIDYTTGLNVVKPAHIAMEDIEEISDVSIKDYPYFISQVSDENKQRIEEAFLFLNSCRTSFLNYLARIKNGANRSQARGSLCHHTQAELVVTANLREWLHIFKLRDSKEAHQDFRLPIAGLRNLFAQKYPIIFNSSQIHPILFKKTFSYGEKYLVVPEEEGLQIESGQYKNHKETVTIPVS